MQILKLALLSFRRDWRAGEMQLIALAIIVAVSSLTSVGFFTDRVSRATQNQATELLAADLVLVSRRPISGMIVARATAADLQTSSITELRSMIMAGEQLHMAEIKAVDAAYPIRGSLRVTDNLFSTEQTTEQIPKPGNVWLDNRLFQLLGVDIGDSINVGASRLIVNRIITYEPDRGGDMFNIAPRLMMNLDDLPATELILPASRVEYRLLLGGDEETIAGFRQSVTDTSGIRVQGIRDARPELRMAMERAEQFLGLAVLVSIALAGLAIAMSTQQYVLRHFDNCAIMRCLGASQRTITGIYIWQLLILALTSSLAGCILGYGAQFVLAKLLSGLTTGTLPAASLFPMVTGVVAGIVTVTGFALPQILRLRTVPPLRVLRRDLAPMPPSGFVYYGAAILSLALLTPWQSGSLKLTAYAFAGILLTALLLTFAALILIRFLSRYRSRLGFAFRFGLANIVRRASLSVAQILGIGLGIMVMLLLTLVRTDLLDSWRDRLSENTPNYFLINIQETDVARLRQFLEAENETEIYLYPMARGRLAKINGETVVPENIDNPAGRRWAQREYNLTWSTDIPAANSLVAGAWWTNQESSQPQFSMEEEFATELGVGLNDTLSFLVAGREISGPITSLRKVEWDSFKVNFFVVGSPGALQNAPASYVTSFYLPFDKRDLLIDLVKLFPSVTVFDVDALITQVRRIMDQVISTVEFVFGFTLLAGVVVLIAALQTTHTERSYESALLSTIGASRRQRQAALFAEFICIGLIAGTLAAFSATLVELLLARYVFNIDIVINYRLWFIAPLVCTGIIVIAGMAGTRRVLNTPPMVALRRG